MVKSSKKKPLRADEVLASVHAALAIHDTGEAIQLANAALEQGVETPLLLNLSAYNLELQGRLIEAMGLLERAFRLAPADPVILNAIGRNYSKQGQAAPALRAFEMALSVLPSYAAAHNGRGLALEMMGQLDGAWAAQETAARLAPAFPDPLGAMASMALQREDWAAARAYAERALALEPFQSAASVSLAVLDQREGDHAAVATRMGELIRHGVLAPLHEATAQRLLADALDAMGRPSEAFPVYTAANQLLRHAYKSTYGREGVEGATALTARLIGYFERAAADAWRPAPGGSGESAGATGHVFLVGFPRSGATLLEQALVRHPGIVTLDEQATFGDVGVHFFTNDALDNLAALDAASAERLRTDYWERVRAYGVDPKGKVFVDKLPLRTLWLPYIAKLFPDAKVLFVRRDPRDVVLNAFCRRFQVTPALYPFTELNDLARFYTGIMDLAEVYREKLDLPWRVHRHEDLIEDFDTEVKAICDFLEVEWASATQEAKQSDGQIPDASRAAQSLYRGGTGQWRAYADGLAPVMPILQPLVDRYGYSAA
ncbi:MAG: sulfotransferase [Caulobacteraceae bacterium]